jgi:MFS family permease
MLPMFLAAIDQTIVATALPAIAGSLGEVERVSWVVVSYLVASTIAAPVYGRLGDVLGRRRMLITALCIFIGASVFCAVASSMVMLTVARVVQGLGGGGLMTLTNALVGETVPPRERGRYQGYLASVFVVASTFGPVAGGWLTEHFGWPSVFLVNLPLGAVALVMVFRLRAFTEGVGRFHFDFIGVVLFSLFIAPLLLALEQAQRFPLARMPTVLVLLGVAALSLVLLLRHERQIAAPLLPIALLRQHSGVPDHGVPRGQPALRTGRSDCYVISFQQDEKTSSPRRTRSAAVNPDAGMGGRSGHYRRRRELLRRCRPTDRRRRRHSEKHPQQPRSGPASVRGQSLGRPCGVRRAHRGL